MYIYYCKLLKTIYDVKILISQVLIFMLLVVALGEQHIIQKHIPSSSDEYFDVSHTHIKKITITHNSKGIVVNSKDYTFFDEFVKYVNNNMDKIGYVNICFEIESPQFIMFYFNINKKKSKLLKCFC